MCDCESGDGETAIRGQEPIRVGSPPLLSFHFCNLMLLLLCLLVISCSCAVTVQKAPFHWPLIVSYMEGAGDIDLSWRGRRFSGSFALKLESPAIFLFEVYGPFGQTLLHLRKEGERVDIVTAEGRMESERFFEEQYGMSVDHFIDDLMMKETAKEATESNRGDRAGYKVSYAGDRDRPRICWLNLDGSICLTFSELVFTRDGQNSESSRK